MLLAWDYLVLSACHDGGQGWRVGGEGWEWRVGGCEVVSQLD